MVMVLRSMEWIIYWIFRNDAKYSGITPGILMHWVVVPATTVQIQSHRGRWLCEKFGTKYDLLVLLTDGFAENQTPAVELADIITCIVDHTQSPVSLNGICFQFQ